MNIPFPPVGDEHKPKLQEARDRIATAQKELTNRSKDFERFQKQQAELESTVDELTNSADPTDLDAMARLSKAQTGLGLVERRLAELEETFGSPTENLRAAIRPIGGLIEPLLKQFYFQVEEAVTEAIGEFYFEKKCARDPARQTDAVTSLGFFMNRVWGHSDPLAESAVALQALDALLAGKSPWSWPPPR